jgi:hypothetical protein
VLLGEEIASVVIVPARLSTCRRFAEHEQCRAVLFVVLVRRHVVDSAVRAHVHVLLTEARPQLATGVEVQAFEAVIGRGYASVRG